jgi:hypothetical protein
MREAVGTMGLLMTGAALMYLAKAKGLSRSWRTVGCVALLALLAWKVSLPLLTYRDFAYGVPPSTMVTTHGTAHSLFIGLGVVENEWGIQWLDGYASDQVAKIKPDVSYASPEYFAVLKKLYVERLLDDPMEVLGIYVAKAKLVLSMPFPELLAPLCILIGLLAVDVAWLSRQRSSLVSADRLHLLISALCLGFVGLFVLQAMLAHPKRLYSEPINAFVVLALATWLSRQFTMSRPQAAL